MLASLFESLFQLWERFHFWREESSGWGLLRNQSMFSGQKWLLDLVYWGTKTLLKAAKEDKLPHTDDVKILVCALSAAVHFVPWDEVLARVNEAFAQQQVRGKVVRIYPFPGSGVSRKGIGLWKIVVSRDGKFVELYILANRWEKLEPGLLLASRDTTEEKMVFWRVRPEDLS